MNRAEILAAAVRTLDSGRGVAIATVVGAHGSTPRHLGARMVVADDGEQWGTIGGGKIEQVVASAAREVAAGGEPRTVRHHLVRDLAMCCGGSMEIALTEGRASRGALAASVEPTGAVVLVTPLSGEPMVVRPPRPGDPAPPRAAVIDGALVERFGAGERVVVFGLGHVARALGPLLAQLGFEVIVCDDGDTGALAESPPWAARSLESFEVADVERALGGPLGGDDSVLIITRDHAIDQRLLEQLIGRASQLRYLGMIGSRGKVLRFRKRLEAKGLLDESGWSRLRAPIGLDIGAETPDEIAVAIAAELVALRRRGTAGAGSWA